MKIDDSWSVAEVLEILDETNVQTRLFQKFSATGYESASLWQDVDNHVQVNIDNVLPIRPQTELVTSLSTCTKMRRKIIFQVANPEFIESLCTL